MIVNTGLFIRYRYVLIYYGKPDLGHHYHEMENGLEAKRVKMDDGSLFSHLKIYPPDPIFHVKDAYLADKSPNKVNLGIGGMEPVKN